MPARACIARAESRDAALAMLDHPETSPWSVSLNGEWRFDLFHTPEAAPSDWWRGAETASDQTITVPSHWQLAGRITPRGGTHATVSRPHYTNWRYPFPIDPPHVPTDDNPTAIYQKVFRVPRSWRGRRVVLRFDGVEGATEVACNGRLIGQHKGSRLVAEFDLADHLRAGDNHLAVKIVQFGDHSYLEDQDMWWLAGIFREVTLLAEPPLDTTSLRLAASLSEYDKGLLNVTGLKPGAAIAVSITYTRGKQTERFETTVDGSGRAGLETRGKVSAWSAESPELYTVLMEIESGGDRCIAAARVGFRRVEITAGGILQVNGRAVKLRGVNRHEWNWERGRSVTRQDMLSDVLAMKRANINCVRTAHYPPHPHFLELCDRFGLYVIDECDLESHGMGHASDRPFALSDDPAWRDAHLDRIQRTVARDMHHASVIMWSLGNECGWGSNLAAMGRWCKAEDPTRPVHYAGDWRGEVADVISQTYPPPDRVAAAGRGEVLPAPYWRPGGEPIDDYADKAFFACEYAHAMGNGPGGLAEYDAMFDRYDRLCGGCVWEWIDHGIRTELDDGRIRVSYGGDFGETPHDGNFVCDGLLFADRTPSPGLHEVKAVFAPVTVTQVTDHTYRIKNHYAFRSIADLCLNVEQIADGRVVTQDVLPIPDIAAGESADITWPHTPTGKGERHLNLCFTLAEATDWAPAGHEVASCQFVLPSGEPVPTPSVSASLRPEPAHHPDGHLLCSLFPAMLTEPRVELWRSPIDNECRGSAEDVAKAWHRFGLHRLLRRLVGVEAKPDGSVDVRETLGAAGEDARCSMTYRYTPISGGARLGVTGGFEGRWPETLPRIALAFQLPATIERVGWFGRGPHDNYRDACSSSPVGRYTLRVDDLHTPHARPQDNGLRTGVRSVEFFDRQGTALRADFTTPGDLQAHRYRTADLDQIRHDCDLPRRDRVFVHLGHLHNGLGSHSCGPELANTHRLRPQIFSFSINFTA
ncbi:MAG: glycoside hydrolase family 2 TIM barrel-domain containing protein [Planctomycetota bacterium]